MAATKAGGGNASALEGAKGTNIQTLSPAVLRHLKAAYKDIASNSNTDHVDLSSFLAYMTSPKSNAMAPAIPKDSETLSYPLSNYFISSSHNTYLTGNQLYSQASGDAYRNVCMFP